MPEQYVKLHDSGVILPSDWAGVSDGVLTIQLSQTVQNTLAHIVTTFDDPAITDVILFHSFEGDEKTFEGYTHIVTAMDRRAQNHGVMIQLIQGEGN